MVFLAEAFPEVIDGRAGGRSRCAEPITAFVNQLQNVNPDSLGEERDHLSIPRQRR